MARNAAAMPDAVARKRRRVIPWRFARAAPSSFTRASTRRCRRVCGAGMNSSLETLCVGIGPAKACVSAGRRPASSRSLSSPMGSSSRAGGRPPSVIRASLEASSECRLCSLVGARTQARSRHTLCSETSWSHGSRRSRQGILDPPRERRLLRRLLGEGARDHGRGGPHDCRESREVLGNPARSVDMQILPEARARHARDPERDVCPQPSLARPPRTARLTPAAAA